MKRNLLLGICSIAALFEQQTFAQIPSSGLVAHYNFSNTTNDQSGLANNATATGTTFTKDRFGNASSALSLSSTGELTMPAIGFSADAGVVTGNFTISLWLKTSNQLAQEFLNLGESPADYPLSVFFNSGKPGNGMLAGWITGEYLFALHPSDVTNNVWHHIVISRKQDTMVSLYVDKVFMDKVTMKGSFGAISKSFSIGKIIYTGGYTKFQGEVDDIAFYNKAVGIGAIDSLYHDGQKIVITSPQVTDAYPLNDTCWIKWKCPSTITTLKAEFSTDNGSNWTTISSSISSSDASLKWPLSFAVGTNVKFKLSDASNAAIYATSTLTISKYKWDLVKRRCDYSERDGAGLVAFKNKLWYIGGWGGDWDGPSLSCNEVWSSTDGVKWDFEMEAPWKPRHEVGWLVYNDKMWVLNGDPNSGILNKDVWNSDDGIHWNKIIDSLPMPERLLQMNAVYKGKMLLYGGETFAGLTPGAIDTAYNDVWSSSDGKIWNQITTKAPWEPRGVVNKQCTDKGDTLWMLGGARYDSPLFTDIWNTTDGITWNKVLDCAPWPGRKYSNIEYFDDKMWVFAGNNFPLGSVHNPTDEGDGLGDRNDVWYSSDGRTWFELKNTPWPVRHGHSTTILNNSLFLGGGYEVDMWKITK